MVYTNDRVLYMPESHRSPGRYFSECRHNFQAFIQKIILNIHNMKSSYTFVNSAELTNASSSWPHSSPGNNHMCVLSCFSRVWLFVTPWTVACQAPLSMGFSRKEYWSGLPCPPPGDLPNLGIEPRSLMSPALADGFFTTSTTWETQK